MHQEIDPETVPFSEPRFRNARNAEMRWVDADGSILENLKSVQQGVTLLVEVPDGVAWGLHRWAGKDEQTYDERPDLEEAGLRLAMVTAAVASGREELRKPALTRPQFRAG